MEALSVL